jgi:RDD family
MSHRVLLIFSLFSAITLALAYRPILTKLSIALASPYPKADMRKRFFAAMVDGTLVGMALIFYRNSQLPAYLVAAAAYLLLRDAAGGRSVGKFLCGLVVINLATGRPCGWGPCVGRNVLFVLPGANVIAVFLETATIVRDPQGLRLGDRFALTQVVEGFGAKDVVTAVQEWWLDFIGRLDRNSRKPRRAPVRLNEGHSPPREEGNTCAHSSHLPSTMVFTPDSAVRIVIASPSAFFTKHPR